MSLSLVLLTPRATQVFGTAPDHAQTSKLPQHGFARTSTWEFLGKSTSESAPGVSAAADQSVKLDFGLSKASLDPKARELWPFAFNMIYSVTLNQDSIVTNLVVTNEDDKPWDCQVLMHTYLRIGVSLFLFFVVFPSNMQTKGKTTKLTNSSLA